MLVRNKHQIGVNYVDITELKVDINDVKMLNQVVTHLMHK